MAVTAETFRLLRSQQAELNELVSTLDGRVQAAWYSIRADLDVTSWGALTPVQRRNLAETLNTQWGRKLETIAGNTKSAAQAAAAAAWAHQEELANTQAPTKLHFRRPDPTAEEWMNRRTADRIESRARALSNRARVAMYTTLNQGVQQGLNPKDVARRAVRMARDFNDVIDGGIARALTIARTEVLDAYRESSMLTQQANTDVLEGWVWVAKLSAHTCRSCWAKHGTVYPVDQPGPGDHPQGRCARVPKTKSWSELGFEGVDEVEDVGLDAVKAFKKMTEDQQKMVLGQDGFNLWKAGQWPRARWAVEEHPADWRPFFRAAKPPSVSVRPPVLELESIAAKKTPQALSFAEKHAEAKARYVQEDANVYGYGVHNQMHTNPQFMYDSTKHAYSDALTSTGELAPIYADNLAAVTDAGDALLKEWYARVEKRIGAPSDSRLNDLNQEVLKLKKKITAAESELQHAYTFKSGAEKAIIEGEARLEKLREALQDARIADMGAREARTKAMDAWMDAHPGKLSKQWYEMARKAEGEELKGLMNDLWLDLGQNKIEWHVLKAPTTERAKMVAQMEQAERLYPGSWVDRAVSRNRKVWLEKQARGYNADYGKRIALSDVHAKAGIGDVNHTAIHELGHSMETAVQGLAQMEWAFLYERSSLVENGVRAFQKQTAIYRGSREYGFEDGFALHYTGKVYDGSNWEVFTTGIESLWAGSGYMDAGFKRWLLGVLSVL